MKSVDVAHQRREASQASRGASEPAIHDSILAKLNSVHASGDVLDFGAGSGELPARLFEVGRFSSVTGADLMERPARLPAAIRWASADLNDRLGFADGSFDTVVACEVIEHLENPRFLAREWFRILRPGGVLVLSTPNNESLRALLALVVRGHFVSFDDSCYPAHITALVRKDVKRILGEAGFVDVQIDFTHRGCLPGLTRFRWQSISTRFRGLRWSDGLVATARTPTS